MFIKENQVPFCIRKLLKTISGFLFTFAKHSQYLLNIIFSLFILLFATKKKQCLSHASFREPFRAAFRRNG